MNPPTKFSKMRANREAYEWRKRDMTPYREAVKAGVTAERLLAAPLTPPAVPTMEVDGMKYKEAPDEGASCHGCAFADDPRSCADFFAPLADKAFGGPCGRRNVIYIRAE